MNNKKLHRENTRLVFGFFNRFVTSISFLLSDVNFLSVDFPLCNIFKLRPAVFVALSDFYHLLPEIVSFLLE